MEPYFIDHAIYSKAVRFVTGPARSEDGILARTIDRRVPSAATQGTVAVSLANVCALESADLIPTEFKSYLLSTFFRMAQQQTDDLWAWDRYEHTSVWATARALQGILAIEPDLLKKKGLRTDKVMQAFRWLEKQRNVDGGYPFQHGLASRTIYTCFVGFACLQALSSCERNSDNDETVRRLLNSVFEYLLGRRVGDDFWWPDICPGSEVCPLSTLFACSLFKAVAPFLPEVSLRMTPGKVIRASTLIRTGLKDRGAFYEFAPETAINWRFEEFIPGRIPFLLNFFDPMDAIIQENLGYLRRHVVYRDEYCGWGYAGSTEPVIWLTALAVEAISSVVAAYKTTPDILVPPVSLPAGRLSGDEVFVVHGHDGEVKEAVARFLEKNGLKPIILSEQTNRGLTVVEKLEAHSNVNFAVVLLTPDDHGSKTGEALVPRARQNVLIELGYFIGKLGRSRVCVLRRHGTDIPSDYAGVLYVDYDAAGGWKSSLLDELRQAGLDVRTVPAG